jgi:hypothetical protein
LPLSRRRTILLNDVPVPDNKQPLFAPGAGSKIRDRPQCAAAGKINNGGLQPTPEAKFEIARNAL